LPIFERKEKEKEKEGKKSHFSVVFYTLKSLVFLFEVGSLFMQLCRKKSQDFISERFFFLMR